MVFMVTEKKPVRIGGGMGRKGAGTGSRFIKAVGKDTAIDLIMKHGGIVARIAKTLHMKYDTIAAWKKDPDLAAAFHAAAESTIDLAEDNLIKNIKSRDNTAIIFYLKCKGLHRGYIETQRNVNMTQNEYAQWKEEELDSRINALSGTIKAAENRITEVE